MTAMTAATLDLLSRRPVPARARRLRARRSSRAGTASRTASRSARRASTSRSSARSCGASSRSSTTASTTTSRTPGPDATGLGKPLKIIVHPLRADIPIYLAAIGPKNVALAAEIADGWLPIFFSPERVRETYGRCSRQGFARRGGKPGRLRRRADGHRRRRRRRRRAAATSLKPHARAVRRRHGRAGQELLQRARAPLRLRGRGQARSRTSTSTARSTKRPPRCPTRSSTRSRSSGRRSASPSGSRRGTRRRRHHADRRRDAARGAAARRRAGVRVCGREQGRGVSFVGGGHRVRGYWRQGSGVWFGFGRDAGGNACAGGSTSCATARSYFDEAGRPLAPDDVPLTEEGRAQALAARALLEDAASTASSRAGCRAAARRPSSSPRATGRGVARPAGDHRRPLSSIPPAQLEDEFVRAFHGVVPNERRFLGGETIGELFDRVLPALDRLVADPTWDTVLVVAHGAVNRAILSWALTGERSFLGRFEQAPGLRQRDRRRRANEPRLGRPRGERRAQRSRAPPHAADEMEEYWAEYGAGRRGRAPPSPTG